MELTVLGTGSSGNSILLSRNNKTIILDAGLNMNEITCNEKSPKFENIDLLFVSHCHKDHSRSLNDFKMSGIDILSYENIDINNMKASRYGNWLVQPFMVSHNVENYGLIIKDLESGTITCYCTDFNAMPKIEHIDNWIYEINYDDETVEKKALKEDSYAYTQIGFKNHNSLWGAVQYFGSLQTKPKNIFICHISLRHSNYKKIKLTMQQFCDNVQILQKGDYYVFN